MKSSTKAKSKQAFSFEEAIASLESLVKNMESGQLSLEASLKTFEEGIALSRECQSALSEAKLKVDTLLHKTDGSLDTTELSS
ncbi:MAG: exodeoxyribonuclease VII small subunit [Gammaproteobacteria bacterium]